MPWVGFEPTNAAGERPKTYALDRTATGTGSLLVLTRKIISVLGGPFTFLLYYAEIGRCYGVTRNT